MKPLGVTNIRATVSFRGASKGVNLSKKWAAFKGQTDWRTVDPGFLDGHAVALSFFSEAGFRFFLPAYLIADLQGKLSTADPLFHLTHGVFGLVG